MSLDLYIWTVFCLKTAVQLASQSWPTESRESEARWGKPWADVASGGRPGIGSWVVWVDGIVCPLGIRTWMAGFDGDTGSRGRVVEGQSMKCPVAPVSG
jgi:hypothetical protein